ncbi:hypothetical protein JCM8202_006250 [Rhodotorula sphaerocarpa]
MDAQRRQLNIKTGVVNRLHKELQVYREEAKKTEAEIKKLEEGEADEYEVRQQRRILAESERMIPDAEQRLAQALGDLEDMLESAEDTEASESEAYKKAIAALKLARPQ